MLLGVGEREMPSMMGEAIGTFWGITTVVVFS
jgi:hypothetical protein